MKPFFHLTLFVSDSEKPIIRMFTVSIVLCFVLLWKINSFKLGWFLVILMESNFLPLSLISDHPLEYELLVVSKTIMQWILSFWSDKHIQWCIGTFHVLTHFMIPVYIQWDFNLITIYFWCQWQHVFLWSFAKSWLIQSNLINNILINHINIL